MNSNSDKLIINNLIKDNLEKFEFYYDYLVKENEKYNLTAITKKDEVFIKHFEDSLHLFSLIKENECLNLLDVGSGAGFPSLPLKICFPNLKVTIIEPTLKRVRFMEEVCKLLDLQNVNIICDRSENIARDYKNCFDIVCARAVANLSVLSELLVSFCKVDGFVCAYKGEKAKEELAESSNALKLLGLKYEDSIKYDLDNDLGKREILILRKIKETSNKYPRRYSEIKKNPL